MIDIMTLSILIALMIVVPMYFIGSLMDINVRQLKPLLVVLIAGLLITGPLTAKDMNRDRQVFFENEYGKENIVKITTETRGGGFLQDPDYYTIIELTDGRVIEYTGVNANQLMYNRERRSANKK